MKTLTHRLEVSANIAIVVVAILLSGVLVQRLFFPNVLKTSKLQTPEIGAKLSLTDYDWSSQSKTVLLVLQKSCRYCTESASFYQQLIQKTRNQNVKVIAVLPSLKEESEKYLNELGLSGIEVRQSPPDSLQVKGTPTVLIINNRGEVLSAWLGKLSSEKEIEVINQL